MDTMLTFLSFCMIQGMNCMPCNPIDFDTSALTAVECCCDGVRADNHHILNPIEKNIWGVEKAVGEVLMGGK